MFLFTPSSVVLVDTEIFTVNKTILGKSFDLGNFLNKLKSFDCIVKQDIPICRFQRRWFHFSMTNIRGQPLRIIINDPVNVNSVKANYFGDESGMLKVLSFRRCLSVGIFLNKQNT